MKKRTSVIALILAMLMILSACGESAAPAAPAKEAAPVEEAAPAEGGFDGKLHGPFIMTTCGQSTGSVMLHMVAGMAGATSVDEHNLSVDTFDPKDAKTLVVTTGTSGKGMGAAGTDVNAEIKRCSDLIAKAREAGMTIVCAHVEGKSRRTDSADQASIDNIIALCDIIVCVDESDHDGLFSNYAAEHNLPILKAKDALSLQEYFSAE